MKICALHCVTLCNIFYIQLLLSLSLKNGYISLLSKHLKHIIPEKEKHYLEVIADSARQMGILIDDLLNFSRTGRQEMQLTELDMNVVLKDAL